MTTKSETNKTLREIMNTDLVTLDAETPALEGAKQMRDRDVGNVLVTRGGELCGIVTDRDLVVRCVADGKSPETTKLGEFCTGELVTVKNDAAVGEAVKLMADRAIRRVPVVESGKPVGIVSLGDLAVHQDRQSALGEISAAKPNN